jgi:hypothetical protein
MVEDATRTISMRANELEDFKQVRDETERKMTQDKIRFLEARGYRVILNNTKSNTNRDKDMIAILEANGWKVSKC